MKLLTLPVFVLLTILYWLAVLVVDGVDLLARTLAKPDR